jgi:hypothetical protein
MLSNKDKPSFMGQSIVYSSKMNIRVSAICKITGRSDFEVRLALTTKGFWESQGFQNSLRPTFSQTVKGWQQRLRGQNAHTAESDLCIQQIDKLLRVKKVLKLRVVTNKAIQEESKLAAFA